MRFANMIAPAALAAGLLFGGAAQAGLSTTIFSLADHPDGGQNPPGYGVRFDNIFTSIGGPGGTTSFSMNTFGDTTLTVTDDGMGGIQIDIVGTLYGGVDTGDSYGFGEGAYALDFTYAMHVMPDGTGWIVDSSDPLNGGTLTALAGNADVAEGEVFSFTGQAANGPIFLFNQDGHRLDNHPEFDPDEVWVGRGWFNMPGVSGTQDFLFVGTLIPAPGSVILLAAGGALGATRRRR